MSNLVKQYYVIQDEKKDGPVVINSNKRMEEHFKRLAVLRAEEEERKNREEEEARQAEFIAGLNAEHLEGEEFAEGEENGEADIIPMPIVTGPSYEEIVTEANEEAERILADARSQSDAIIAEAQEKGKAIFEEQKASGYAAGEEMVAQEIQNATTQLQMQYQMQTQALQDEYQEKMSHMEADIVDAIIQVFDRVFHIQFEDSRDILLYLISNTMLQIHGDKKFKIYTTADQISFLEEHMQELREKVGADVEIELMYDGSITTGGCRIETDHGVFDCGIDTELSNIYQSIRSLCD